MRTRSLALMIATIALVPLVAQGAFAQGEPEVPEVPEAPAEPAPGEPAPGEPAPEEPVPEPAPEEPPPPPEETTPPEPPPPPAASTEAPTAPPTTQPAPVAPTTDTGVEPEEEEEDASPPETTLGVEGQVGLVGRVGSISSGYDSAGRAGMLLGAGVFFSPMRMIAGGLTYGFTNAGSEEFDPIGSDQTGKISRRLHTVAANLRLYPIRTDDIGLFAGLMLGLTWQTGSAAGSTITGQFPAIAETYQVGLGPSAGLALGAGVGVDIELGDNVGMLTSLNLSNHRLTSDPIDADGAAPPIPGIGNTTQLDFRLGFQYRFELPGGQPSASGEVETAQR